MNALFLARKSSWECLTVPLNQPYMRFFTWLRWRQINFLKPSLNIPSSKSKSCPSFPLVTSGSRRKASCYFWQPPETKHDGYCLPPPSLPLNSCLPRHLPYSPSWQVFDCLNWAFWDTERNAKKPTAIYKAPFLKKSRKTAGNGPFLTKNAFLSSFSWSFWRKVLGRGLRFFMLHSVSQNA